MLFFEGIFLYFFLAVALVYVLAHRPKWRRYVLLVASYTFYAAWNWKFMFLIAGSTLADYFLAARMEGKPRPVRRQLLMASLVVNLGSLAIFKYLDFGIESLNAITGAELSLLHLTLPVGISFFTFQSMSYTIDVYRGNLKVTRSLVDFAVFVSFFPQLVAGPIIRAADFLPQLGSATKRFPQNLERAVPLFVLGLFKKVVIAEQLARVANPVFADPTAFALGDRLAGILAFSGQIYCDFSGYTDMALALCLVFGLRFPDNFRSPYLADGPQEFWRRWHISLSTWLRDYLYFSLGGSRRGIRRMYLALMGTMLLGGLWHGASWTFVLWGLFHGLLLVTERFARDKLPWINTAALWPVRWATFFGLTLAGWVLFRAESVAGLFAMWSDLPTSEAAVATPPYILLPCMGFVLAEHVLGELRRRGLLPRRWPIEFAVAGILLMLSVVLRPETLTPFIYFQF